MVKQAPKNPRIRFVSRHRDGQATVKLPNGGFNLKTAKELIKQLDQGIVNLTVSDDQIETSTDLTLPPCINTSYEQEQYYQLSTEIHDESYISPSFIDESPDFSFELMDFNITTASSDLIETTDWY